MSKLMVTCGYNFEHYTIENYIKFCSGECVLGTGFLSNLSASFADTFGTSSKGYENKLAKAKDFAIEKLEEAARSEGANAIIGLQIDFETFSADIMGVVASGMAVYIEKIGEHVIEEKIYQFPVINYYPDLPFRIGHLLYNKTRACAQIDLCVYPGNKLQALNADFIVQTIFDTQYIYRDINLTQIETNQEAAVFDLEISENELRAMNGVIVHVHKYINNNQCCTNTGSSQMTSYKIPELLNKKKEYGIDVIEDYVKTEQSWTCLCGMKNSNTDEICQLCGRSYGKYIGTGFEYQFDKLIERLQTMESSSEIYQYLLSQSSDQEVDSIAELLEKIETIVKKERIYGDMRDSCMKLVKEFYKRK